MANITIDQLSEAINQELTIYSDNIIRGVKTNAQTAIKNLVERTKETAPVGNRQKHYRDNIASRKLEETDRSVTYQWYVKAPDYRLSHLLEKGHATKNGGRTKAYGFISMAEERTVREYEAAIEEVIRFNG